MCVCLRLVLSRFEVAGTVLGESAEEEEEDEEEVWLFWKDSSGEVKSKSIRELAQDAKEGHSEDQEVISYYRYTHVLYTHTPPRVLCCCRQIGIWSFVKTHTATCNVLYMLKTAFTLLLVTIH